MHKIIIIATAIGLGFSGLVFAQSKYELGTKLSPAEISALGNLKSFSVSSGTSTASSATAVFRLLLLIRMTRPARSVQQDLFQHARQPIVLCRPVVVAVAMSSMIVGRLANAME